jgi:hypothetical protein
LAQDRSGAAGRQGGLIYVAGPQHPKSILNPPSAVRSFAAIPP